ncbi:MAG: hypothetical protein QXF01_01920 [Candidatus Micrarchaeaceae archaeon]
MEKPVIYAVLAAAVVVVIVAAYFALPRGGSAPASSATTTASFNNSGVGAGLNSSTSTISAPATTVVGSTTETTTVQSNATNSSKAFGQWVSTSSYPLPVYNQSCVGWHGYIYCVGGQLNQSFYTSDVYFANATPAGIGRWMQAMSYPVNITGASCSVGGNFIFCVGGMQNGSEVGYGYYAELSPSGISGWNPAVPYSVPAAGISCTFVAGYDYCIGGFSTSAASVGSDSMVTNYMSGANYATFNNGTYQFWLQGRNYPANTSMTSCVSNNTAMYCMAGTGSQNDYFSIVNLSNGYNSPWIASGTYPLPAYGPSCAAGAGTVYCIGGYESGNYSISNSYYATINGRGFGPWISGTKYPQPGLYDGSCAIAGSYIYCVGGIGQFGGVYYARI